MLGDFGFIVVFCFINYFYLFVGNYNKKIEMSCCCWLSC